MFQQRMRYAFLLFAALLLALPVSFGATASNLKPTTATVRVLAPASVGGKPLNPGTYQVIADSSTVTFKQHGKAVAAAPVEWKDESRKAESTSLVADNNAITEIHFEGKTRYAVVKE